MNNIQRSALLFVCLFGLSVQGRASDFTLFGGVQKPGSFTLRDVAQGAGATINPRNFGTFGMRFTSGTVFGTEQTIAYSPNFISSENSAFIYNSNLAVQAPFPGFRPYGTVGLGTVYIGGDNLADIITGAKFAINYGGGVKVGGAVGAQFDARGYTIRGVADDTLNVLELSVGLVFTF